MPAAVFNNNFPRTSRTSQIRGRESRVAERVRNSIRRISTALFEAPKDKNKLLGTLDESIEDSELIFIIISLLPFMGIVVLSW